jgi:toxin ParE1/3/4
MKIERSPEAEQDILEIWLYVAKESGPRRADFIIDKIEKAYEMLVDFPEIGNLRPDIAADVRGLVSSPYLILYRIGTSRIEIARIVHGSRDLPSVFNP